MSEEPTTAAVQRYLNALAGDAPAEPIVREPPSSASPRHPLTRCTSPPCDRCPDDPTLVCAAFPEFHSVYMDPESFVIRLPGSR